MCTSIVFNGRQTIVGWNLDILDMEYRVSAGEDRVCIEINDAKEGWLPLFGANARGDFVAMPTCWPYDRRSDPSEGRQSNLLVLDIDLLLEKRVLGELREIAESGAVCSVPGMSFQAQLSDREGNVLQIVPGQGSRFLEKPRFSVMTNFSPFKGDSELHPWMGLDRYNAAVEALEAADEDFGVDACFDVLRKCSQTVCPTVVSMVFDVAENAVYWCEGQNWEEIRVQRMRGKCE
ncbi:MAG: hypothetical protein Q4G06_05350 [Clostridia bacterium]|nr:hypothetical protein [Clostridia bacterium]